MRRLPPKRAIALGLAVAASLAAGSTQAAAPDGRYECWYFSTARPLYNFTLRGSVYLDTENHRGTVAVSGNQMTFSGGNLDGQHGVYTGGNPPNVSFRDAQGNERFFCQRAGA